MRVLAIDDDDTILLLIKRIAKHRKWDCVQTFSLKKLPTLLEGVDVAIVDWNMPGAPPGEAYRICAAAGTPVVIFTGSPLAVPGVEVVEKGVRPIADSLIEAVERIGNVNR